MFTYKYNILYNVFLVTSKQASALKYANRHRERGGERRTTREKDKSRQLEQIDDLTRTGDRT